MTLTLPASSPFNSTTVRNIKFAMTNLAMRTGMGVAARIAPHWTVRTASRLFKRLKRASLRAIWHILDTAQSVLTWLRRVGEILGRGLMRPIHCLASIDDDRNPPSRSAQKRIIGPNGNGGRPVKKRTLVSIVSSRDENALSATSAFTSG